MATQTSLITLTFVAGADLSGSQLAFVALNANGEVVLPSAGADCIGVLQNKPALGEVAQVVMLNGSGRIKVNSGATMAVGVKVQAFGTGAAVAAASGDHVLGTVAKAVTSGEVVEILPGSRMLLP